MELYKIAVDEYRFNVRLGWDRAKFLVTLHSAWAGVVAAVHSAGAPHPIVLAALSSIGAAVAYVGVRIIRRSHEYYRRAIYKKTLLEEHLGLTERLPGYESPEATLAIGTTSTQSETGPILEDPEKWLGRKIRPDSVTGLLRIFLWGILGLHVVNIGWQVWQFCRH